MKVAVPEFAQRVSPRFDCANAILVVELADGREVAREQIDSTGWPAEQRVGKLVELGIDTLICGAVDRWSAEALQAAGITVYGWVTGQVEDALACLLRGELQSAAMAGAGGRCCGRWRFRGGRWSDGVQKGASDQSMQRLRRGQRWRRRR